MRNRIDRAHQQALGAGVHQRSALTSRGLVALSISLLVAVVTVGCSAGTGEPQEPAAQPTSSVGPVNSVMYVGDSLTSGYFATSRDASFTALVNRELGDPRQEYAALADQDLTTVSRVVDVPSNLQLAVIELGTNDVGNGTPIADFRSQYRNLLTMVDAKSPRVLAICLGVWTDNGQSYDDVIRAECKRRGGHYLPIGDLYADSANRGPADANTAFGTSDDFHPNDRGHKAIAARITEELRSQGVVLNAPGAS